MNRLSTFVFGVLVGAALMFTSLKYHIIRAEDGLHLIPKVTSQFGDIYVDIRQFGPEQWSEHRSLTLAIAAAKQENLLEDSVTSGLRRRVEDTIRDFGRNEGP